MLPKRSQADTTIEAMKSLFDKLFSMANTSNVADNITVGSLKKLKHQVLSAVAEEEGSTHKQAKEFTFDEAVQSFGLTFSPGLDDSERHLWEIEMLPDVKNFQPSACLRKVFP